MKDTSYTVEVPQPPEGLTVREQARWWVGHTAELQVALIFSSISPEVMEECERVAKDNDLAYKVIGVSALTKEEKSRLFELLTDGGFYDPAPSKKGRKPKVKQALAAYDAMQEHSSVRGRNQALRVAAGGTYHNNNTDKLRKKAELANEQRNRQEVMLAKALQSMKAFVDEKAETEDESQYFTEVFTLFLQKLKEEAPDDFDALMHSWFPQK